MRELADESASQAPAPAATGLQPPQKLWHVFLLMTFTFGIYSLVYTYQNARDLRSIDKQKTLAWAWPFGIIISLAAPYVFDQMTRRASAIAAQSGQSMPSRGVLIGILILLISISQAIHSAIDGSDFALTSTLVYSLLFATLFTWLAHDMNKLRRCYLDSQLRRPAYSLSIPQIITLVVGGLLSTALYGFIVPDELAQLRLPTITAGSHWKAPDKPYRIEFQDDWKQAPIGTYSEDDALAEFSLSDVTWTLIFDYSEEDVHTVADNRRELIHEEESGMHCVEQRSLHDNTLTLTSQLECNGTFLGDKVLYLSTQYDNGEHHVEILSYTFTTALKYQKTREKMLRLAANFDFSEGEQ